MWFSVIGAWCSYELGLSSSAHQLLDRFFDLSIACLGRKACLNKILSTRVEDRDLSSLSISASSSSACTIRLQMQAGLSKPTIHLLVYTHRPQSSSFWGLPYRILNIKPKKELLWGLWVVVHLVSLYLLATAPSRLNALEGAKPGIYRV